MQREQACQLVNSVTEGASKEKWAQALAFFAVNHSPGLQLQTELLPVNRNACVWKAHIVGSTTA
eukprot:1445911-Amphidinium_carterae.1